MSDRSSRLSGVLMHNMPEAVRNTPMIYRQESEVEDYSKNYEPPTFDPVSDVKADKDVETSTTVNKEPVKKSVEPAASTKLHGPYASFQTFYDSLAARGLSKKARAAVTSQMGLEVGWHKGGSAKFYNYGNIIGGKGYKGKTTEGKDTDAAGNPIIQKFRHYENEAQFIDDYFSQLQRNWPKAYEELHSEEFDHNRFTKGLADGRIGRYAATEEYEELFDNTYRSFTRNAYGKGRKYKNGGVLAPQITGLIIKT